MFVSCVAKVGMLPGMSNKGIFYKTVDIENEDEGVKIYNSFINDLENQYDAHFVVGEYEIIKDLETD